MKRDKVNLDIFWLKDQSLVDSDDLPAPDVLAQEIADDLQTAREQFTAIAEMKPRPLLPGHRSGQNLAHHPRLLDTGQPDIESLEGDCETLVVETELMQQRGVQIVNVDWILGHAKAEFVRLTITDSRFESAPRKPHGEGVNVMIAAGRVAHFAHRRAAKLATPHDNRVIEQARPLQITHQCGAGLVDFLGDGWQMRFEILR